MAGAGYKLFNTGDVLTAAQVNTYLQEQVVMVFANAAARTTALSGVLAEGMVSYLKDTDAFEIYSGSAWVGYGSGDITAVVAGTGLSGGATSGSATLSLTVPVVETNGGTNQTSYATGDLLYASAANTLTKRAIGTSGQVLTVSAGVPTWATPASSTPSFVGVRCTTSSAQSISSSTWTALTFNTETFDTDNFHSTSSNTSRITIPSGKGGYYLFVGNANFDSNSATGRRIYAIYKNGTIIDGSTVESTAATNVYPAASVSVIINGAVGDYFEFFVNQTSGGALNMYAPGTAFHGQFLGA